MNKKITEVNKPGTDNEGDQVKDIKNKTAEFMNDLSKLLKEYNINGHAASFIINDKPILSFSPDIYQATKILKNAHSYCMSEVLKSVGEQ
jgi:hypothetical protein